MLKACKKLTIVSSSLIFLLLVSVIGCKDDSSPVSSVSESSRNFNTSVSFYSPNNLPVLDNTIIITEAKFVLRQMNLKESGGETLYNLRLDPFVVHLDVNGRVIMAVLANVPSANYHQVKFQVHKPSPQENVNDPDFVESNSRRFSVVVRGYYNGQTFCYKSSMTSARGIDIENNPIFLPPTASLNITLVVNPYEWFDNNGVTMDPRNENNSNDIDHNIRDSFRRAFRDMDMNGRPD